MCRFVRARARSPITVADFLLLDNGVPQAYIFAEVSYASRPLSRST